MTALVDPVLLLWIPIVLLLFRRLPPHRAVIAGVVAGMLFLPEIHMYKIMADAPDPKVVLIIKLTKENAVCFSVFLGVFLFDFKQLKTFQPHWYDLPILVWCLSPFFANLNNDVSVYDSFAATRDITLIWGIPYFLGRIYFTDPDRFRDLAVGLIAGGLVYAPLCLFEIFTYPTMHFRLYGFHANDPSQLIRYGGFRPIVFMEHGLAVGMWMVAVTMLALWLWSTGTMKRFPLGRGRSMPMWAVVALLLFTTALVKSTGALLLGVVGIIGLFQVRLIRWPILMTVLITFSPIYIMGRTLSGSEPVGWMHSNFSDEDLTRLEQKAFRKPLLGVGGFTGHDFFKFLNQFVPPDRTSSLRFRLKFEDFLMEHDFKKPFFGWGDRGAARVKNKKGDDVAVTDGLWIITLGNYGFVGLTALWATMLLPSFRFLWNYRASLWKQPAYAAAAVSAMILGLYMIDCLTNAMINMIYVLLVGGLAGFKGEPVAAPAEIAEQRQDVHADPLPPIRPRVPRPSSGPRPGVLRRPRPLHP